MKQFVLFLLLLIGLAFNSNAQIADPGVGEMSLYDLNNEPQDPFLIPINGIVTLKLPVLNNHPTNTIKANNALIKINLGSKLVMDPSFNLNTANTSQYFAWTTSILTGGNVEIKGTLIATLPSNYSDTAIFRLKGAVQGPSSITTNFLVANLNANPPYLSDQNGNNNTAVQSYEVISALPVTFTSFTAQKDKCMVNLLFNTADEINVDRFEIEVSNDGRQFKKLGSLDADNLAWYQFGVDISSDLAAKYLYFRIKSVDFNGYVQYSAVNKISGLCNETNSNVSIFPNPSPKEAAFFTVRTSGAALTGTFGISISDITGRVLNRNKITLLNQQQFNYVHGYLPSGDYIIQIHSSIGELLHTGKWQKR